MPRNVKVLFVFPLHNYCVICDLFPPSLSLPLMPQNQAGIVHLEDQLTEQEDGMLTKQGETTFWMKIKLPFSVVGVDLSGPCLGILTSARHAITGKLLMLISDKNKREFLVDNSRKMGFYDAFCIIKDSSGSLEDRCTFIWPHKKERTQQRPPTASYVTFDFIWS